MVQFLSIIFFLGFLPFLLGVSKVPVFCVTLYKVDRSSTLQQLRVHICGKLKIIRIFAAYKHIHNCRQYKFSFYLRDCDI